MVYSFLFLFVQWLVAATTCGVIIKESSTCVLDVAAEDGDEQGADDGAAEQNTEDAKEEDADQQPAADGAEVAGGLLLHTRSVWVDV